MRKKLPDDELRNLDTLAQITIAYLVTVGLSSFFIAYVLAARYSGGIAAIALFGLAGSAVAALTSCLDRYATGFEREDGTPYPEKAKEGAGKFNRRFARWLFTRPFLGAMVAPVFVWGLRSFTSNTDRWTESIGFTAFMGGLLAKSVVDLVKRLFKNTFNA